MYTFHYILNLIEVAEDVCVFNLPQTTGVVPSNLAKWASHKCNV